MMEIKDALNFIHGMKEVGRKRGLSQTQKLLDLCGNPEKKLKFVHVGGTNGKGSTCAMLAEILFEAGYKVGLYTSPYVVRFNERIRVSEKGFLSEEIGELPGFYEISDERLSELTEYVSEKIKLMEEPPSEFEVVTVIAMLMFAEEKCDIVVLEVGMGGEFDSTNVIPPAEVTVITNIGLEHTEYLGDTVAEIATTKSKIIKTGTTAVFYGEDQDALEIVGKRCEDTSVDLIVPDFKKIRSSNFGVGSQSFDYEEYQNINLQVLGEYQQKNAVMAIEAVKVLKNKGYSISDENIKEGLYKTVWRGRFEILGENPLVIMDGSHNPQGMRATVDSIKKCFDFDSIFSPKIVCVFGVMAGKDYGKMTEILSEIATEIITVAPEMPKSLSSDKLKNTVEEICKGKNISVVDGNSVKTGVKLGMSRCGENDVLLCVGSLFLVTEARDYIVRELPLSKLRMEIDVVDSQIIELFEKRQVIAENIGNVKKKSGMKVFDPGRESIKLDAVEKQVKNPQNAKAVRALFQKLMDLSKNRQNNEEFF